MMALMPFLRCRPRPCRVLRVNLFFTFERYFCISVDVVVDVVAVSAVLRMHDSPATTFGSRCFNKLVILRFVF